MTDVISEINWTEKYRPKKIEDVALTEDNRAVLLSYLEAGEIPNLLMLGPAGSGKTTIARIICRSLDCRVLSLNASADRGIDVVRGRIQSFVTARSGARWNIPFLDEADAMTADAQTALRNLMESYHDLARFILTANYGSKIIGPIQSRCQLLAFERPPLKERWRILTAVLAAEEIEAEPQVTLSYAERYPDLRRMLWAAQRAYLAKGELPMAMESGGTGGADLYKWLLEKNWTAFRRITGGGEFEAQQLLRELFHAIPDDHPKCGQLRHVIGRGVHETGFTPDPIVLFLAVIAGATEFV